MSTWELNKDGYALFNYNFKSKKQFSERNVVYYYIGSAGEIISTHTSDSLQSLPFAIFPDCYQSQIYSALGSWSNIINRSIRRTNKAQQADLKFYFADMGDKRGAVGYPYFQEKPCSHLSGSIIINSEIRGYDCESFYNLLLHEIGHAFGLGHVEGNSVMNKNIKKSSGKNKLQPADSAGIKALYLKKPANR